MNVSFKGVKNITYKKKPLQWSEITTNIFFQKENILTCIQSLPILTEKTVTNSMRY